MYLSNIKLWNFRKYGSSIEYEDKTGIPDLDLNFNNQINVLIGSNDSGKTGIIDAIKLVLKTHSYEYIRPTRDEFYGDTKRFRIELLFKDFSAEEASNFLEWIGFDDSDNYVLRLVYDVSRNDSRIFPSDVKAGIEPDGSQMNADAREYLKITYLKPLRDAGNELVSKKGSRISQILIGDEAFKGRESSHDLIDLFKEFNQSIEKYFEGQNSDGTPNTDLLGKALKERIDTYIHSFYDNTKESNFTVYEGKLKEILEKISISIKDEMNLGLGTLNRLFMATELIHLNRTSYHGLSLALIEELEAHLHPQAQMQVIEKLQAETNKQLILTTHSPNLASKVKLQNLIVCNNQNAYPMGETHTKLKNTDYKFLERFIDTTKANLFFAKGVIFVEGWAEELLLPTFAKKLGYDLTQKQISVVNIANTAFLRYVKIFQREVQNENIGINVSVITDLDLIPIEYENTPQFQDNLIKHIDSKRGGAGFDELTVKNAYLKKNKIVSQYNIASEIQDKKSKYEDVDNQNVKAFISNDWTLEYCIAKSTLLRKLFFKAVLKAHKEQKENEDVSNLTSYTNAITNIDTHFTNWTEISDEIAFKIYWQVLGEENYTGTAKDKISKSIIAQHFAELLDEDTTLTTEELKAERSINYLIEAIEHVCN